MTPDQRAAARETFASVQVWLPRNGELHRAHVEAGGKTLPVRGIAFGGVVGERGTVTLTIPADYVDLELID